MFQRDQPFVKTDLHARGDSHRIFMTKTLQTNIESLLFPIKRKKELIKNILRFYINKGKM